ncbi:unnamed protein product, partial [Owenia fusiformis]
VVTNINAGLADYTGVEHQISAPFAISCDVDSMELSISAFALADDNTITLGTAKDFSVDVSITPSGASTFSNGGSDNNYDVMFYISLDDQLDTNIDTLIDFQFRGPNENQMSSAVNSEETHTLDDTFDLTDEANGVYLALSDFCLISITQSNLYLFIKVVDNVFDNDPVAVNNVAMQAFTLACPNDLLFASD